MNKRSPLIGVVVDIGLPTAAYYGCRALGIETHLALLVGGLVALLRVAAVALRQRRLDGVAALVAGAFAALLAVSAVSGDDRVLLARESILSGTLGLLLLGSCAVRRPLMYSLLRRLNSADPQKSAHWDVLWRTRPQFRRTMTIMSFVWGAGLLSEAIIRIPLIFLLPVDVLTAVSTLLQIGTIALLLAWTLWYRRSRATSTAPGTVSRRA